MTLISIAATLGMLRRRPAGCGSHSHDHDRTRRPSTAFAARSLVGIGLYGLILRPRSRSARSSPSTCSARASSCCSALWRGAARRPASAAIRSRRRWSSPVSSSPFPRPRSPSRWCSGWPRTRMKPGAKLPPGRDDSAKDGACMTPEAAACAARRPATGGYAARLRHPRPGHRHVLIWLSGRAPYERRTGRARRWRRWFADRDRHPGQLLSSGQPLVYLVGGWKPPLGLALRADGISVVMMVMTAIDHVRDGVFARGQFGFDPDGPSGRAPDGVLDVVARASPARSI